MKQRTFVLFQQTAEKLHIGCSRYCVWTKSCTNFQTMVEAKMLGGIYVGESSHSVGFLSSLVLVDSRISLSTIHVWTSPLVLLFSTGTFPIPSRDPSFRKTSFETQGKRLRFLDRAMLQKNGQGIRPRIFLLAQAEEHLHHQHVRHRQRHRGHAGGDQGHGLVQHAPWSIR